MKLLITFVNQSFTPDLKLGVLDLNSGRFRWIIEGCAAVGNGATGIAVSDQSLYVCGQQSDLLVYGGDGLRQRFESELIQDPHTLKIINDRLYCVSSWTNEIILLTRDAAGNIIGEEPFWRVAEAEDGYDSVHLNSIDHNGTDFLVTAFGKRADIRQSWSDIQHGYLMTMSGKPLRQDIKQPHSAYSFNGETYYCESLTGCVHALESGQKYEAGGYTRGICVTERALLVGSSHRRKISKSTARLIKGRTGSFESGVSGCRITAFDIHTGEVLDRHDLSAYGNEIYEIAVAPDFVDGLIDQTNPLKLRIRSFEHHAADVLIRAERGIESETSTLKDIHQTELGRLEDRYKETEADLSGRLRTLEDERSSLELQNAELTEMLSQSSARNNDLEQQRTAAEARFSEQSSEIGRLKESLVELTKQRMSLEGVIEEQAAAQKRLQDVHNALLSNVRSLQSSTLLGKYSTYRALLETLDELE